ncbi:cytochrome c [Sphingobium sp.]|uniref:cytochrome c n=1 Tax=Sphingobium sp. TaxID=1912891 RepID=UPI0025FA368B|nr:cytochrome c [Sphingobium sp.]
MRRSVPLFLSAIALAGCGERAPQSSERTVTRLQSDSIVLPDDTGGFGGSAAGKLLEARCTACHSASMILRQPPLSREQWTATVIKMREAYKAPVAEGETEAVVDALMTVAPAKR